MKRFLLALLFLGLVAGSVYWRLQVDAVDKAGRKPPGKAVSVTLASARRGSAPIEFAAIGELVSAHAAAIRPQVSGTLTRVLFSEGQDVTAGQPLFEIDPAPAEAALAQARAQIERDRASLSAASAQAERLKPLLARGYVTPQEVEAATAAAGEAAAQVKLSEGLATSARITLSRSRIASPIAGRSGSLSVKSGNVVSPGDALPLVTINQLHPIQAQFAIPQSQLQTLRAATESGAVRVIAADQSGQVIADDGRVQFIDNTVDATTGTVKVKAAFANADNRLWPGSFVTLTVRLGEQTDAVLVPEASVQQGAEGAYVFLIGKDSKVSLRPVTVDRQLRGETVIAKGLQGGESLVARAPRDLKPGTLVTTANGGGGAAAEAHQRRRPDAKPGTGSTP